MKHPGEWSLVLQILMIVTFPAWFPVWLLTWPLASFLRMIVPAIAKDFMDMWRHYIFVRGGEWGGSWEVEHKGIFHQCNPACPAPLRN